MATLKIDGKTYQVKDGDSIKEAAREHGVFLACESGVCRVCEVEVISGAENLSPLTEEEKMHDLPQNHRLACQCKILRGKVELKTLA